eukprot:1893162-Rhodomonas_salina.1
MELQESSSCHAPSALCGGPCSLRPRSALLLHYIQPPSSSTPPATPNTPASPGTPLHLILAAARDLPTSGTNASPTRQSIPAPSRHGFAVTRSSTRT